MLIEQFLKKLYGEKISGEFVSSWKWDWYDLEDFKEYQIWDNIKKINWRMFAKYDKEYISLYRIEKEPILDIFLDVNKNFEFFCDEIKNYFSIVKSLLSKYWIIKNLFQYYWDGKNIKIKKIDRFSDIKIQKKEGLDYILNSKLFNNTNHYKIIISDFLFVNSFDLNLLLQYFWKIFFVLLPIGNLLKEWKLPVLNWYFDSIYCIDMIKDYNKKVALLKKIWIVELL